MPPHGRRFVRLRHWGAAHRLRLAHPFGAIPAIGRRFRFIDWPWPGSSDTVFKSAHGLVTGRHAVAYGSNARYLFDLSDLDGNRLVLLGGQDGMPGSPAFLDQTELFRRGEYITVPLDPATARANFPHHDDAGTGTAMIDATPLLRLYAAFRASRLARQDAAAVQQRTLQRLLRRAAATRFGRDHDFARPRRSSRDFQSAVPLRRYEDFWSDYWQPAFPNLVDVSWPGRIPFFAASSGTSTGATKFIPVTAEMIALEPAGPGSTCSRIICRHGRRAASSAAAICCSAAAPSWSSRRPASEAAISAASPPRPCRAGRALSPFRRPTSRA